MYLHAGCYCLTRRRWSCNLRLYDRILERADARLTLILCCDGLIIDTLQLHFPFLPAGTTFRGKQEIMDGRRGVKKRDEGAGKITQRGECVNKYKPISQGRSFPLAVEISLSSVSCCELFLIHEAVLSLFACINFFSLTL